MLDLEFAELSDPGKVRVHNEDYLGHSIPATVEERTARGWLFALADGVGGEDRGEVASQMAVETVLAGFRHSVPGESSTTLLARLVQAANLKIYETAAVSPGGSSMSTTLVACLVRFDRAMIAHVGDSRCYLIRRGKAKALTRDHTLVAEQVRLGLLSAEEARDSERRHVLSRSLGANMIVHPELDEHQLWPGDLLLLSSDGLHGSLSAEEIAATTGKHRDLGRMVEDLVSLASRKDGSDNLSAQLIRINEVERIGMYRGRPYRRPT
jgi:PPM family protein phosphatase